MLRIVIGAFALVFLFLNTYSSGDDMPYGVLSYALTASIAVSAALVSLCLQRFTLPRIRFHLLGTYGALLLTMTCSTFLNSATLPSDNIVGLLNNIATQLLFVGLLFLIALNGGGTLRAWSGHIATVLTMFALFAATVAYQRLWTGTALLGPLSLEGVRWPQLYGWFSSPNFFVNAVAIGLLTSVYRLVAGPRLHYLSILPIVFLLLTAALSGSKGGLVALVGALAAFVLVHLQAGQYNLRKIAALVLGGSVLLATGLGTVLLYLYWYGSDPEFLLRVIIRVDSIETGTGRLEIWRTAVDLILEASILQALLGYGNGYFEMRTGVSPHNGHLRILVEFGVVAYALVLLLAIQYFRSVRRHVRDGNGTAAALWASVFVYIFLRTLFNSSVVSGGFLGFAMLTALFLLSFRSTNRPRMRSERAAIETTEKAPVAVMNLGQDAPASEHQ